MLKFIGRGSAFNVKEGNNSAFIKNGNHLLLIDCGSDVFSQIQSLELLNGIEEIDVLLTHMHPDHFGSLGDLIYYSYFIIGKGQLPKITIHHYSERMNETLEAMGVYSFMYHELKFRNPKAKQTVMINENYIVEPILVNHYPSVRESTPFNCLGFFIETRQGKLYYSGDSNEIPQKAMDKLVSGELSAFYQDTCALDYDGNVHLYYGKLLEAVSADLRHLVHCMHIDIKFDIERAKNDGFNVVERYGK